MFDSSENRSATMTNRIGNSTNNRFEIPRAVYQKDRDNVKCVSSRNEDIECEIGENDGLGSQWKFWKRRRYIIGLLAFLGFFNVYALRVNLSVAIVAMTNSKEIIVNNITIVEPKEFDWNSKEIGLVLSSFFYGYICTQILGGWLAAKYGGNLVFGFGIAFTALLTLVTPPLAKINFYALLALRVVEGLFEGVTYPCIHAIWSKWAPPLERSKLASLAFSGSYIGTVISLPLCGVIANTLGWEAIFYIFGAIALVWYSVWSFVVKTSPNADVHISNSERIFIQNSLGNKEGKEIRHPWKDFVKSMPVWSIVVAHFCENWGFYTMLTQLPKYMNDTLGYKIEKAGFLSGLPYLVMAIVLQLSGQLADYLRSNGYMTTTRVRKLFTCGAFLFQTVFMLLAGNLTTPFGIIGCLVLAVGMGGFAWSGFAVNHLDIAPQHASVLMGFGNTFATLPGMISPLLTGFIVQNKSAEEWRIVFYIASTIYLVGAVFYGLFASGDLQAWAQDRECNGNKPTNFDNKGLDLTNENVTFSNK